MSQNSIYEQLLYSTTRIECLDDHDQLVGIGTGFLMNGPVVDNKTKVFLVSNKHVLMTCQSIRITFNSGENGKLVTQKPQQFVVKNSISEVKGHPTADVDIAILDITALFGALSDKLYFKLFSTDLLADFTEPELNVAENIYFVGYPDGRYDQVNNLPLVRTGIIASHPKFDYNGLPEFVVDAEVIPGSSGSPVLIDLAYENARSGDIILGHKFALLGVVAATMIRENRLQVLPTSKAALGIQETIGLGLVFKAPLIKELILSAM